MGDRKRTQPGESGGVGEQTRPRVPLRKAAILVLLGMVCGFCAVLAFLIHAESDGSGATVLKLSAVAILALFGAIAAHRRM